MIDPWIRPYGARAPVRTRLICFPHAGGSATVYRPWATLVPPHVEVCAIELPGRGTRFGEPLLERMSVLLDHVEAALSRFAEHPFVLFGHSMGAVVAYELALRLQRRPGPRPSALIVSGRRAPQLDAIDPPIHRLSDDAFVDAMSRRYGGIPEEVLQHKDLMELLLPMLRADLAMLEEFDIDRAGHLECPVHACGGTGDAAVPVAHLEAWRARSAGGFGLHTFPGGHFYLSEQRDALLRVVVRVLAEAAGGEPHRSGRAAG